MVAGDIEADIATIKSESEIHRLEAKLNASATGNN